MSKTNQPSALPISEIATENDGNGNGNHKKQLI